MDTRKEIPDVARRILEALELPNEESLALEVAVVLIEFHKRVAEEAVRDDTERWKQHGKEG